MKKVTLMFAFIGMIMLQSCTVNETTPVTTVDNDTIAEVFEVTTSFNSGNGFSKLTTFGRPIYASDMVLVYHLYDVVNGADVWRLMPQTYYFTGGGELDYNFDFTRYDVNIFLDANFDLTTLSSSWTQNQTFRIVIVPASFSNKSAVNYKDYAATLKKLNIENAEIKKLD